MFLMRQASSKRDCLSVYPSVCMYVCHTFLHICKVHTCDVIMYLLAHHSALRSCFISNPIFRLSLELLSEVPKMRLKIAMKLLTFFGDYRLK